MRKHHFFQKVVEKTRKLSAVKLCLFACLAVGIYFYVDCKWKTQNQTKERDLMNVFVLFNDVSRQFGIESFIIEPSLLFYVLSLKFKSLLLKRNFTVENRSQRVLTLGIFQKDAVILEKEDVQFLLGINGFRTEIIFLPILYWMESEAYLNRSMFIGHIFLQKDKWILHLVVFHKRKNFLWHSALMTQAHSSPKESFLFVDADAAFENFTATSFDFKIHSLMNVNIPSNTANFLHQIASSRFLECNETIVSLFRSQHVENLTSYHISSSLTSQEFNDRLLITIQELKSQLEPLLMNFWIWAGTLLGVHRQCDVIPYTSDADFAAWETDDDDVDSLINIFKHNEHLTIVRKFGMAEEGLELQFNCDGLTVDLFFIYKQKNGTWYAGHSPNKGYYFKYHHPSFSLCSAELLGQKVNVPCELEDVISAEYGSNWIQPESDWGYDTSAYNMGPNIYWDKSLLKKAYIYF